MELAEIKLFKLKVNNKLYWSPSTLYWPVLYHEVIDFFFFDISIKDKTISLQFSWAVCDSNNE